MKPDEELEDPILLQYFSRSGDDELQELVGLSSSELIDCSIKSLNKIVKRKKISKEKVRKIKDLRRRLRNRTHAKNQRVKKEQEVEDQSEENLKILKRIDDIMIKTRLAKEEQKRLQARLEKVESDVLQLERDESLSNEDRLKELLKSRPNLSINKVQD